MSEADRLDIIQTTDELGNSLMLLVEKYFYYNGEEYALLREVADENGKETPGDARLHVMRIEVSTDEEGEEIEDFVPVAEDLEESLIRSIKISYTRPEAEDTQDA